MEKKIETIGDLREVIKQNGGELKIGKLTLAYEENGDIDINFDDSLIQWFSASNNDTFSLTDEATYTYQDSPTQVREEEGVKWKEYREMEKKLAELEKTATDNNLALGKVEAYEKILIGRAFTVEAGR